MLPQEIIRRKRDGQRLSQQEIAGFVAGLTSGAISAGQGASFASAGTTPSRFWFAKMRSRSFS